MSISWKRVVQDEDIVTVPSILSPVEKDLIYEEAVGVDPWRQKVADITPSKSMFAEGKGSFGEAHSYLV